jgi:AraC-like DNA-binding protein
MLHCEGVAVDHAYGPAHEHRPSADAPAIIQRFHDPVELALPSGWVPVAAGTCLVSGPGRAVPHRAAGRPFRTDWMVVDGPLAARAVRFGCPLAHPLAGPSLDVWRNVVDGLARECWLRERHWQVAVDHRLQELHILLARSAAEDAPADVLMAGVRTRILREPERPWTIADMAGFAGLSRQRFSARFASAFGVSPLDDLLRVRIQLARHLLRNTGLPIAAVAVRCGFRDLPWFHRCFRRRTGLTPRQARMP